MRRWALLALGAAAAVAVTVLALRGLDLHGLASALAAVRPGWLAAAFVLMALSLVLRGVSWVAILRAALPGRRVTFAPVLRAAMIGVMASAALPGRLGEPARAMVVARRLGDVRGHASLVGGTIVAQTVLNLVALAILMAVVLGSTQLFSVRAGVALAVGLPVVLVAVLVGAPGVLARIGGRVAAWSGRQLEQARGGLRVFRRAGPALAAALPQLAAWALQVAACDAVLQALGLHAQPALAAAAAVLLAVNVTAIVPLAPSNVGVFQAACVAVLAAYGVSADRALAYGIVLQAVEVFTALALGLPALAGEGLSWSALRSARPPA